jgi:hypothetical protein
MRWARKGNAFVVDELTPDLLKERDARLRWAMLRKLPFSLLNGTLVPRQYQPGQLGVDPHMPISGEELSWLTFTEGRSWKGKMGALEAAGVPMAGNSAYGAPGSLANSAAFTAVTGGVVNVAWINPSLYTSIPLRSVRAPASWRAYAAGLITSSGAGQTITMNPAIGTAVAGQALGASAALALGSTITGAFWRHEATVIAQLPDAAGRAVGEFQMAWGTTAGATPGTPTATNPSNAMFGGGNTQATVDWTANQGYLIAATPSAAGVSVTPTMIVWTSND